MFGQHVAESLQCGDRLALGLGYCLRPIRIWGGRAGLVLLESRPESIQLTFEPVTRTSSVSRSTTELQMSEGGKRVYWNIRKARATKDDLVLSFL